MLQNRPRPLPLQSRVRARRDPDRVVVAIAALSAFSPYNPLDTYVVPPDVPPSWAYPFGTTSRGQDTFWILTFAMRNTLLFGFAVAILSRLISLARRAGLRLSRRDRPTGY